MRVKDNPLYGIWNGIVTRCYNEKHANYKYYGSRGITMNPAWRHNARMFIEYMEALGWEPGLQVDRKDNDGNYTPGNVRVVTPAVNSQNRRHRIDSHTEHPGVYLLPSGAYRVRRMRFGKRVSLGTFNNLDNAISAYKAA